MPERYGMTTGNRLQEAAPVHRWRLEAESGLAIELLDLGATLHRVEIPDGHGAMVPLSLSLDSVEDREDPERNPYLGVSVGRYANRLGGAEFTLDGLTYAVDANEGNNQLHGGAVGFSHVVWDATEIENGVRFHRVSPDGEMGFPGSLDASVTYVLHHDRIAITFAATTDAPTVVSMTNHTYWNLGGPTEDDVGDHVIEIAASTVVPIDGQSLPSGKPEPVGATPFDLQTPTRLGDRLGFSLPNGFDHCFVVNGDGLRRHSTVTHPSGRALELWSDQPGVQLYTGAFLSGGSGADDRFHEPFGALCLEPQHLPDAPNLVWAPSAVLRPGENYVHELEFRLTWNQSEKP